MESAAPRCVTSVTALVFICWSLAPLIFTASAAASPQLFLVYTHDWEAWEKPWHCSALGDILNCTSCGKQAGVMGTISLALLQMHTPAKDPPEFVRWYGNTGTLVQWIPKGRVMCGRLGWWGPFIFLHAIRRMRSSLPPPFGSNFF